MAQHDGDLGVLIGLLAIVPMWKLLKRTGHSPWMSLFALLPIVNIVLLYVFAFKSWPSEEKRWSGKA